MKRLSILALTVMAFLGILVQFGPASPGGAQDRTDERLSGLETQVADQSGQIASLKKRVKKLEHPDQPSTSATDAQPKETPTEAATTSPVTVAGTGKMVSEKFHLASGQYKVSAQLDASGVSGLIVHLHGAGVDLVSGSLFNEFIELAGPWTGSTIVTVARDGDYFVSVDNTTDPWKLSFEQF